MLSCPHLQIQFYDGNCPPVEPEYSLVVCSGKMALLKHVFTQISISLHIYTLKQNYVPLIQAALIKLTKRTIKHS